MTSVISDARPAEREKRRSRERHTSHTSAYLRGHARIARAAGHKRERGTIIRRSWRIAVVHGDVSFCDRVTTSPGARDRAALTSGFLGALLCQCWPLRSAILAEHGAPAAGRQCISVHYPKITIIL